jgi:hypothetical protein
VLIRNEINSSCAFYCTAGYARFSVWYSSSATPTYWNDGVDDKVGGGAVSTLRTYYEGMISTRLAVPSPLEMDLDIDYGDRGDTVSVSVHIVAVDTISCTSLRVRTCVVEDDIFQSGYGGGHYYDQVLRDYFCPTAPHHAGTPITISLGDTVIHTDEFVMDPTWDPGNCRVVAFVQNGVGVPPPEIEREVIQAVQAPVLTPPPAEVTDLTITLVQDDLRLEWSPVTADTGGGPITIDHYQVYRDTLGFFDPGSDPFLATADTVFTDTTGVVGDHGRQYYYAVTAVASEKESAFSTIVGEFDGHMANTGKLLK